LARLTKFTVFSLSPDLLSVANIYMLCIFIDTSICHVSWATGNTNQDLFWKV